MRNIIPRSTYRCGSNFEIAPPFGTKETALLEPPPLKDLT
jgi:hypothetical protein